MSDLISRQDLLKLFENLRDEHETNAISYVALYEVILQQPTIEAAPVVEAEWILVSQWKDEDGVINPIYRCSACHIPNDEEDRFCKHCGADMRKGGADSE